MRSIKNVNVKNKIVLLRSDLNSDVVNGKIIMSERIKESANTIKFLKNNGSKVVVISHQGRPKKNDFISLKQHSILLNRFTNIKFIEDLIGEKARKSIQELKPGEAILLENLRFNDDEFRPSVKNKLVFTLSNLCDIYVNDAFSNSHRNHSSMVSFPKCMKSFYGPLLEREINSLKKIKVKNSLYILGGAKPEDNLKMLGKNKVLACGLFGQMCLIAKGFDLGAQEKYLKKELGNFRFILKKLKPKLSKIIVPVDFAVKISGKRKEINLEQFPINYEIFDIGSKTIELFKEEIKKASSFYMKGPAGLCDYKYFFKGTYEILKTVANSGKFSVISGGHLNDVIDKSKIKKTKFGYISLSGGATLSYLAGEKLPGLEALK